MEFTLIKAVRATQATSVLVQEEARGRIQAIGEFCTSYHPAGQTLFSKYTLKQKKGRGRPDRRAPGENRAYRTG